MKQTDERDPAAIANEILECIDRTGNFDRLNELDNLLAQRFAARHGWKYTKKRFSLVDLWARPTGDDGDADFNSSETTGRSYDPSPIANPYFFTDRAGRAVAIAAHLPNYNFNEKKAAEYRELATAWGLTVSVITDFPSWYYPGETTLVLWTRGEDLDGEN